MHHKKWRKNCPHQIDCKMMWALLIKEQHVCSSLLIWSSAFIQPPTLSQLSYARNALFPFQNGQHGGIVCTWKSYPLPQGMMGMNGAIILIDLNKENPTRWKLGKTAQSQWNPAIFSWVNVWVWSSMAASCCFLPLIVGQQCFNAAIPKVLLSS